MLDLSSLQYSSEYPGLLAIIYTILCAIMLGALMAFTYEKTSREVERPEHFLQALILVTIVTAIIMQAIGDSVARGLGMMGALSIIRFRTTIRSTRNIVFIFGAIGIGIACGVFGFLIAIVGTLGFCLTAFVLRYSTFSPKENFSGIIRLSLDKTLVDESTVINILSKYTTDYAVISRQIGTGKKLGSNVFEYKFRLKDYNNYEELAAQLNLVEGLTLVTYRIDNLQFDKI